jgi:hypothetical protein
MRFARVKRDDHALVLEIGLYVFHSSNFLQHRAEFAHAFIAILAFSCDLDGFHDGVIGAFAEKRIGWIGIVWSCRVHRFLVFLYLTCGTSVTVASDVSLTPGFSQDDGQVQ